MSLRDARGRFASSGAKTFRPKSKGRFQWGVTCRMDVKRLLKAKERARITGLVGGARYIRKVAVNSIKKRNKKSRVGASPVGTPIHTRAGLAKRSILYSYDPTSQVAYVGAAYTKIKKAFAAHEHGRLFRGYHYEKRPVMHPAMMNSLRHLPRSFSMRIIN